MIKLILKKSWKILSMERDKSMCGNNGDNGIDKMY